MSGQITLASEFGRQIRDLASIERYKRFVDVGTWNGQGSTLCIIMGFMLRENKNDLRIISIEANKKMYEVAKHFYHDCPPFLTLLYGKLSTKMMTRDEILNHPEFSKIKEHYYLWYDQDVKDFEEASTIFLSGEADVVILDGGEFCGLSDFKAILDLNPKVICLDDTNVMKNKEVYTILMKDSNWRLHAEGYDRNCWAIFKKKHF